LTRRDFYSLLLPSIPAVGADPGIVAAASLSSTDVAVGIGWAFGGCFMSSGISRIMTYLS
jgi:hypothetical protein